LAYRIGGGGAITTIGGGGGAVTTIGGVIGVNCPGDP
jgi:hypothetical protein